MLNLSFVSNDRFNNELRERMNCACGRIRKDAQFNSWSEARNHDAIASIHDGNAVNSLKITQSVKSLINEGL